MRLPALLLACAVTSMACRVGTRPRAREGTGAEDGKVAADGGGDGGGSSGAREPPPCNGVGRIWDGRPEGCAYEHDSCCYDDAEAACAAAGCEAAACTVLESHPAAVRCRGAEAGVDANQP
jgi:hypothetical protein